jgi:hypothetical protein
MNRMADYVGVFSGVVPQQREMNRFFSRHGHTPRGSDVEGAEKLLSPAQKRVLPNSLAAVE